jgi:hypothetical protein
MTRLKLFAAGWLRQGLRPLPQTFIMEKLQTLSLRQKPWVEALDENFLQAKAEIVDSVEVLLDQAAQPETRAGCGRLFAGGLLCAGPGS